MCPALLSNVIRPNQLLHLVLLLGDASGAFNIIQDYIMSETAWESGEFLLAFTASCFTFFGLVLRACLKSRCTNISCCFGAWNCDRAVEGVDEDPEPRSIRIDDPVA